MAGRPSIVSFRWRIASLAVCGLLAAGLVGAVGGPASGSTTPTSHQLLLALSRNPIVRGMSAQGRLGLRYLVSHRWGYGTQASGAEEAARAPRPAGVTAALANVRVNNPAGDGIGDPDMTTQNETTVAASGSNIVVGYNDDGTSSVNYKAADDLTGLSFSSNGGATWTDRSLPNRLPGINLGDPAVGVDRSGRFYFASLDLDPTGVILGVVVAHSSDGGAHWSRPTIVSKEDGFQKRSIAEADKDWLTVAPDPANPSQDVVYVSWTDFFEDKTGGGSRIMLSSSHDGGATWSHPVAVVTQPPVDAHHHPAFVQGSNIAGDANGKLYVALEQETDTTGHFTFNVRREFVSSTTNAGPPFTAPVLAARAKQVGSQIDDICSQAMDFGPSKYIRTTEFPVIGVGPNGDPSFTYNTTGTDGRAHIRVTTSTDGGAHWSSQTITSGKNAFMPSLGADSTGVTVTWYQQKGRSKIQTMMATSSDGIHYTTAPLSNVAFGVPFTFPGTDPFLAPCYMGDYLGTYRTGGTSYMAWGDNRDIVTNGFWPNGRIDPDVFFAQS